MVDEAPGQQVVHGLVPVLVGSLFLWVLTVEHQGITTITLIVRLFGAEQATRGEAEQPDHAQQP